MSKLNLDIKKRKRIDINMKNMENKINLSVFLWINKPRNIELDDTNAILHLLQIQIFIEIIRIIVKVEIFYIIK